MMKIAPASRLVTDASLSPGAPPSIERSRPIRPPGGEVADWASVTATARNPRTCRGRGDAPAYQLSVKIWLGVHVVSGKETVTTGVWLKASDSGSKSKPWAYGSPHSRDTLIESYIELVGTVAADQCQFERGACGVGPGRQAVQFKGEAFDPRRAIFEQFWNRQAPVRRRPFGKQIDRPGVGTDNVDQHGRFAVALDVADG